MGDDMEKLIYKVTKPYVYEMLVASVIDLMLSMLVFVIVIAYFPENYFGAMLFSIPVLLIVAIFDAPLLTKCLLDRKRQVVIEKIGVNFDLDNDFTMSNIFSLKGGPDSLLTTWYYPKEWNMLRVKPMFRTPDGKVFKARCILSYAHDQDLVFTHIRGIQRKYDEPILLKVKYLKYSKAILSTQMVSYPHDMKRRTKDYIDKNLSDILRWTIKV